MHGFFDQPGIMQMLLHAKFHDETICIHMVLCVLRGAWLIVNLVRQYLHWGNMCGPCTLRQTIIIRGAIHLLNEFACCTTLGCVFAPQSHGRWVHLNESENVLDRERWAVGKWRNGNWMLQQDESRMDGLCRFIAVNSHKSPKRCF